MFRRISSLSIVWFYFENPRRRLASKSRGNVPQPSARKSLSSTHTHTHAHKKLQAPSVTSLLCQGDLIKHRRWRVCVCVGALVCACVRFFVFCWFFFKCVCLWRKIGRITAQLISSESDGAPVETRGRQLRAGSGAPAGKPRQLHFQLPGRHDDLLWGALGSVAGKHRGSVGGVSRHLLLLLLLPHSPP